MSDDVTRWTAVIGMALMAGVFLLDVRRWRMPRSVVGPRQQVLRCVLIGLIEVLLVMWFLGPTVVGSRNITAALVYWALSLVLILAMLVVIFLDLRESTREYTRQARRISRELMSDRDEKP